MRIGIDLMGSDRSPFTLFPAVIQAASRLDPSVIFVVIATQQVIRECSSIAFPSSIEFYYAQDVIAVDDDPLQVVRHKKKSSLVSGVQLLKKKKLDAFISCGSTGALVASATLSLPKFPGVIRPALVATLPTERGRVAVLDVGGRMTCKAAHLVQFASLGAAFQYALHGIDIPYVGLLNIGVESKKGTLELRQAYALLQQMETSDFRFVGNIEARDLFKGDIDVLVTEGFAGNILLKTAEGVAGFVLTALHKVAPESLKAVRQQFDYTQYPGALLCGVDRLVIKVHGNGMHDALLCSIMEAVSYVDKQVLQKMKQRYLAS